MIAPLEPGGYDDYGNAPGTDVLGPAGDEWPTLPYTSLSETPGYRPEVLARRIAVIRAANPSPAHNLARLVAILGSIRADELGLTAERQVLSAAAYAYAALGELMPGDSGPEEQPERPGIYVYGEPASIWRRLWWAIRAAPSRW